ncbi:hypothetical protein [Novosphingobium sp.]|uniref:hypothetical protein n=1 Tax=Novosphingobium sp. TaxID=1874826 RepID=UPI0038B77593
MPAALGYAAATIAALGRTPDLRALSLVGVQVITALRLCALAERDGIDPAPELARRFRSLEAAFALVDLARTIARCWPEPVMVNRSCCLALSPDEVTVAGMLRHATCANRAAFEHDLAGFVRADRHDALWNASVQAAALLGG